MKKFLVQVILIISVEALFGQTSERQIDSVIVYAGGWDVMVNPAVECDMFFKRFDIYKIDMSGYKKRIYTCLSSKRLLKGQPHLDVKGKMFIYYKGHKLDSVCFGHLPRIDMNGIFFELPDRRLFDLLDSVYYDCVEIKGQKPSILYEPKYR